MGVEPVHLFVSFFHPNMEIGLTPPAGAVEPLCASFDRRVARCAEDDPRIAAVLVYLADRVAIITYVQVLSAGASRRRDLRADDVQGQARPDVSEAAPRGLPQTCGWTPRAMQVPVHRGAFATFRGGDRVSAFSQMPLAVQRSRDYFRVL